MPRLSLFFFEVLGEGEGGLCFPPGPYKETLAVRVLIAFLWRVTVLCFSFFLSSLVFPGLRVKLTPLVVSVSLLLFLIPLVCVRAVSSHFAAKGNFDVCCLNSDTLYPSLALPIAGGRHQKDQEFRTETSHILPPVLFCASRSLFQDRILFLVPAKCANTSSVAGKYAQVLILIS